MTVLRQLVKRRLKWFMGFSFVAMIVTAYLIYLHFEPSASTICTFGESFNCDIVNKSTYSEIFGIPVAVLGFLTYALLFFLAFALYKDYHFQKLFKPMRSKRVMWFMFFFSLFGVLFSLYLTYIEFFVLFAYCIFCLAQQVIIIILTFIMLSILGEINKSNKKHPEVCEFC